MSLVFHAASQRLIEHLRGNLPQSLLLSGDEGIGLGSAARELAGSYLMGVLEPTDSKGVIDHARGTISVEAVRGLYEQTRARHTTRQVVIIDDADHMSHGAQNAFLKLLEEPNDNIHFILTAHQPKRLLPTILSRVQETVLQPLTASQTTEFIQSRGVADAKKAAQLQFIAAGLPAKLARLMDDESYFAEEAALMGDARAFIQGSSYDRLLLVNKYAGNRDHALRLVDSALIILRRSVSANPEPRIIHQIDRLLAAREAIDANHHIKLQLTQVVI